MITVKNINQAIKFLTLIRNSTALMELINSNELLQNLEKMFGRFNTDYGNNIGELKYKFFTELFLNPEYFGKILKGEESIVNEIAVDFVLDKLYEILKEYSETKFDGD